MTEVDQGYKLDRGAKVWHFAYRRGYDQRAAAHPRRSAVWGWIADRLVRWA